MRMFVKNPMNSWGVLCVCGGRCIGRPTSTNQVRLARAGGRVGQNGPVGGEGRGGGGWGQEKSIGAGRMGGAGIEK